MKLKMKFWQDGCDPAKWHGELELPEKIATFIQAATKALFKIGEGTK